MSLRVCAKPGCPEITNRRHCPAHAREADKARGTREQRGYGAKHKRERTALQRRMARGERFTCWRCGTPINPNAWTLGHCDTNRSIYHGPECPPCNYATAGRAGCPHPSHGLPA